MKAPKVFIDFRVLFEYCQYICFISISLNINLAVFILFYFNSFCQYAKLKALKTSCHNSGWFARRCGMSEALRAAELWDGQIFLSESGFQDITDPLMQKPLHKDSVNRR